MPFDILYWSRQLVSVYETAPRMFTPKVEFLNIGSEGLQMVVLEDISYLCP